MRLIVTGGGSGKDTKEIDELFASRLDKTKPLLYIPIAMDNIKRPYQDCLRWLRSTFDNLGVEKYEMWREDEIKNMKEKPPPSQFSGIYIGGGNTPYLLKKIKYTFIWDFINEALKKEIPVYGGSAGALIFSKTIISSLKYDKNWVEIKNLEGFNVIGGHELTCHYSENEKAKIKDLISKNNIKNLIALTEKNGLDVNDKEIKMIGQEKGFVFNNCIESEISINEKIPKIE